MNTKVKNILDRISALEEELKDELREQERHALYELKGGKVLFEKKIREAHRRMRMGILSWIRTSRPQNVVSAPIIYMIVIPLIFLDVSMTIYQMICFRLYGIPAVKRSDYITLDRHRLNYLNLLEKINCDYCSYANGLFAYVTEIGARTEQYWCPIKHARKNLIVHKRYPYFIDYGDAKNLHSRFEELRVSLNHSIEKEEEKKSSRKA
ncbi:hypothetical protein JWG44_19755 [Leptospira sp. 201903071]|uniref:hypothetical protein n=1 Tax=Leptospira ainazelensis TaxID=2810034 RepID=UPI001963332B|nr:hypothetical protein [Leptospira ainazelensis]MBM9502492.1 hypothetical protein [Leptospira ainazelensis]